MLSHNYVASIALFISSIVGVGMFTLPYISTQAGIITVIIYFIALGFLQHWLHTLYAEIILSTKKPHRLPGYTEKYISKKAKKIVLILSLFSGYGALLAYTILGGQFLYQLLNPLLGGSVIIYTIGLLILRSVVMLFGLGWVTRAEVILTGGLLGAMVVVSVLATGQGSVENLTVFNNDNIFLPYGPVFFAVSGLLAINDICLLMKNEKEKIASVLKTGIIIASAIMLLFTIAIASISGSLTSSDALGGLKTFIDPIFYNILLGVGLITVTTSFFIMAEAMEEMFIWDFQAKKLGAWLLIWAVPLFLLLLGAWDFTKVVAITGAVSGGLLGSLYLILGLKVKKKAEIVSPIKARLTPGIVGILVLLFVVGLIYQLWGIF